MKNLFAKVQRTLHCQWNHFLWNFSKAVNSDWFDHVRFKLTTGRKLDYKNPLWLNDKLTWLNRFWIPTLKVQCTDKIAVRNYLQSIDIQYVSTPPVLGIWKRAEDIDFQSLPSQFVLKCNHGCGYNIIVRNKEVLNIPQTISMLNGWLKEDYGKKHNEYHYSYIEPKIFAEEYMSDIDETGNIVDYKLMCVGGKPSFFLVCRERDSYGKALLSSYSLDWKRMNGLKNEDKTTISKPSGLNIMIAAAERIAKDFPFVRVDFYYNYGKVYIGELTFTPEACLLDYCTDRVLKDYGEKLILPQKVNDFQSR